MAGIVCISCRMLKYIPALKGCRERNTAILQLVPKLLAVGIGCRKGTAKEKIEDAVRQCLLEEGFLEESLYAVASIDFKEDEAGLLSYCQEKEFAFFAYSAQELGQAEGKFSKSSFVKEVTGVACVCERSAVLAAEGGELLCHKKIYDGVTVALAARKGKGEF